MYTVWRPVLTEVLHQLEHDASDVHVPLDADPLLDLEIADEHRQHPGAVHAEPVHAKSVRHLPVHGSRGSQRGHNGSLGIHVWMSADMKIAEQ